jgi:FokI, cleavage domain
MTNGDSNSSRLSEGVILDRMRRAIREKGSPPGATVFEKQYDVPKIDVKYYWGNHSALVVAAGDVPNPPKTKIPEPDVFREYVKVCRHCKCIPTLFQLRIATRELKTHTHKVQAHGGLGAFNERFRQWLTTPAGKEFAEILEYPGWGRRPFGANRRVTKEARPVAKEVRRVPEGASSVTKEVTPDTASRYPNLPAGLLQLSTLAWNLPPPGLDTDTSASFLFEQKCAEAFRALGFHVRPLGQGKGRQADFLALAREEHFGVIIDAKARAKGFVLDSAEERKLREYAETHSDELRKEGMDRIYFCVVSSSFRGEDVDAFGDALRKSGIKGWSLWSADVLMSIVDRSIAERSEFRLADLERRLDLNSIVTEERLATDHRSRRH